MLLIFFLKYLSVKFHLYSLSIIVVSTMNEKFKSCLTECKQLNSAGLLRQTGATADKILYNHAIHMVIKFLSKLFFLN